MSGNYIVSSGPVLDPFDTTLRNSYLVYSPDGELLDQKTGKGSTPPLALPTTQGPYLHFAEGFRQTKPAEGKLSLPRYSSPGFFGVSPEGDLSVALTNTSNDGAFNYSVALLKDDGSISEATLPFSAHSVAVGGDSTLVVGDSGESPNWVRKIVHIDVDGNTKEIQPPDGYDPHSPDFQYSHVNYIGEGLFELLQGRNTDGAIELTAFEGYVPEGSHKFAIQKVSHRTVAAPDDIAATRMLNNGESGYITTSGQVFVNKRSGQNPVRTGDIESFEQSDFVNVIPAIDDPKFALHRDGEVSIRRWKDPEHAIAELKIKRPACKNSGCGIATITEIP